MVFSSLSFLFLFFPVTFLLHTVVPNWKFRNALLIITSLVFYAWGEPLYVLLLLFSVVVNWALALAVAGREKGRKALGRRGGGVEHRAAGGVQVQRLSDADGQRAAGHGLGPIPASAFPSAFPFSPFRPCPTSSTFIGTGTAYSAVCPGCCCISPSFPS